MLFCFNCLILFGIWIPAVSGSVFVSTGIFFGGFVKRYGSRIVCIVGAVIASTGYVASSFSTDIVHLYLAYGIVSGNGPDRDLCFLVLV